MFATAFRSALLGACLTLSATALSAAQITFDMVGAIASSSYTDHPFYSEMFVQNLFPAGTPGSMRLTMDYDGDPATAVITDFRITLGATLFYLTAPSSGGVSIMNDVPGALGPDFDLLSAQVLDVSGPSFLGLSPASMLLLLWDNTAAMFDSDTPTVMDFADIGVNDPTVSVTLQDAFGQRVVSYLMVSQDPEGLRVTVDVAAVPLPAAGGALLLALAGLGALRRRGRSDRAPGQAFLTNGQTKG